MVRKALLQTVIYKWYLHHYYFSWQLFEIMGTFSNTKLNQFHPLLGYKYYDTVLNIQKLLFREPLNAFFFPHKDAIMDQSNCSIKNQNAFSTWTKNWNWPCQPKPKPTGFRLKFLTSLQKDKENLFFFPYFALRPHKMCKSKHQFLFCG